MIFIVVGGVLQGIGANVERYIDPDFAWGGVGVLIGAALSSWFARRLRWWLLLYFPATVIFMIPFAMAAELGTAGMVNSVAQRTGECRGWNDLGDRLDAITANVGPLMNDINLLENPGLDDVRRWSASAGEIHRQYEELDHPPILDRYVELSTQVFRNYEEGFALVANGKHEEGVPLVDEGDKIVPQAQAEFRAAQTEYVG